MDNMDISIVGEPTIIGTCLFKVDRAYPGAPPGSGAEAAELSRSPGG